MNEKIASSEALEKCERNRDFKINEAAAIAIAHASSLRPKAL